MKAVAFDTNLALLLVVGRVAPVFIGKHKRLKSYDRRDYNTLVGTLQKAQRLLFTPHCLAEVSNMLGQGIVDPLRTRLFESLKALMEAADERFIASMRAASEPEFSRLGLVDATWLSVLDDQTTLFTDDNDLYLAASYRKLAVVKFSHLRRSTLRRDH